MNYVSGGGGQNRARGGQTLKNIKNIIPTLCVGSETFAPPPRLNPEYAPGLVANSDLLDDDVILTNLFNFTV